MQHLDTYAELVDRCRRKGLIVGLGMKVDKPAAGDARKPLEPAWWLSVQKGSEKPIVAGARGPLPKVIVPLARQVAQDLTRSGWA